VLTSYKSEMDKCCAEQNELQSEICALDKIRGELGKMSKAKDYVIDCEVSEWADSECSKSCGGGQMVRSRSVLTKPANFGMQCLPLEEEEACNEHACPIDCVLSEWEEWSACSAQCGGGVRARSRNIVTEQANDGHACEALQESEGCNGQNCNEDCVLSDWTPYQPCTKGCGVGSQRRIKTIEKAAMGEGTCADETSEHRQEFKLCNPFDCAAYLSPGEKLLKCDSNIDVIFLIDGSATLKKEGFEAEKKLVETFISQSTDKVKVAVMVFGGPTSFKDWKACTGDAANVDVATVCNLRWIAHLNSEENVLEAVKAATYPDTTTLMDMAIAEAKQEVINGRPDANTITVLISDGKPLVEETTRDAAKRLQSKSRLLFVPVGSDPPMEFLNTVVTMPHKDHIISVPSVEDLTSTINVNNVISSVCPTLR